LWARAPVGPGAFQTVSGIAIAKPARSDWPVPCPSNRCHVLIIRQARRPAGECAKCPSALDLRRPPADGASRPQQHEQDVCSPPGRDRASPAEENRVRTCARAQRAAAADEHASDHHRSGRAHFRIGMLQRSRAERDQVALSPAGVGKSAPVAGRVLPAHSSMKGALAESCRS